MGNRKVEILDMARLGSKVFFNESVSKILQLVVAPLRYLHCTQRMLALRRLVRMSVPRARHCFMLSFY